MPEVVVVTEAPAGVERAAAVAFTKRGARLGLLARGRSGLEGARTEVESAGGKALTIPTDVATQGTRRGDREQERRSPAALV